MMGGVCFSVKGINREEKWTRKIKRRTDLFVQVSKLHCFIAIRQSLENIFFDLLSRATSTQFPLLLLFLLFCSQFSSFISLSILCFLFERFSLFVSAYRNSPFPIPSRYFVAIFFRLPFPPDAILFSISVPHGICGFSGKAAKRTKLIMCGCMNYATNRMRSRLDRKGFCTCDCILYFICRETLI